MAKVKKAKKGAPVRTPARKSAPARKAASRKTPARKPAARPPARKPALRRPARKAAAPKPAAAKRKPVVKPAAKPASKAPARPVRPAEQPETHRIRTPLSAKELEMFRKQLLNLRDRAVDEISFLSGDNLNHSQRESSGDLSNYGIHMADQGTDNFDREFALSLVSNEHDVVYEIDEALHRIEMKTYGVCEMTGRPIDIARLKVMPYTRYCRAAQEELERGRKKYRPFGATMLQTPEAP